MERFSAIVLAGGAARRMRGALKPAITVGGVPMLHRVLAATAHAQPRVVVGSTELAATLPRDVCLTIEQPPGGGPVAAIAAGLALLASDPPGIVAILAGDMPFLCPDLIDELRIAVARSAVDGAVLVDEAGEPQWLAGVWHYGALAAAMPADPAGRGVRQVVSGLRIARVAASSAVPPAWFDCDTEEDIRRAEEWADAG